MPIDKFPFSTNGGGIARPYLFVRILNPHTGKNLITYGQIDTGADECAIPASYARILGHDLMAGKEKTIRTGNGTTQAYAHITTIEILHPEAKGVLYRLDNIPVDFLPNLHSTLLGVKNFLGKFILTVDYPAGLLSIKYP